MSSTLQSSGAARAPTTAIILGVLLVIAGMVALGATVRTTLAAVLFIGGILIVAGVIEIVEALRNKHGSERWFGVLVGVVSSFVGLFFFARPALSAVAITTLLAIYFLAAGVFRLVGAIRRPGPTRAWGIVSGVASIALGGYTLLSWPISAAWLLGTLVAVDLVFAGTSMIAAGAAHRREARRISQPRAAERRPPSAPPPAP